MCARPRLRRSAHWWACRGYRLSKQLRQNDSHCSWPLRRARFHEDARRRRRHARRADRISAAKRETSRDAAGRTAAARVATRHAKSLVERYGRTLRTSTLASRRAPLMSSRPGPGPPGAAPSALPLAAQPLVRGGGTLARTPVVIQLATGAEIELRLLPFARQPTPRASRDSPAPATSTEPDAAAALRPTSSCRVAAPTATNTRVTARSAEWSSVENWRGTVACPRAPRHRDAQLLQPIETSGSITTTRSRSGRAWDERRRSAARGRVMRRVR